MRASRLFLGVKIIQENIGISSKYRKIIGTLKNIGKYRKYRNAGRGVGALQSASTDQGHLVAAVFSTADKGPSVSAVVQLTSDYCLPSFFLKSDV